MGYPELHLFGTGFAVKIKDMRFDPAKPYRACLICGDVFQSSLDRMDYQSPLVIQDAVSMRERWAKVHAKRHPPREHRQLQLSGMSMTPKAAKKLAAFGLLPITDMAQSNASSTSSEVKVALLESNPMPTDDSEE